MSSAPEDVGGERMVLVVRKGGDSGLPTACPACLPAFIYFKLAGANFELRYDVANPDADYIPYVELGDYVAFNNEKGGVIDSLIEDKYINLVDLDSKLPGDIFPDLVSTKAMISTWLLDAAEYELLMASSVEVGSKIYFSDLPWPIGKLLNWNQSRIVKQRLGITELNSSDKEEEVYRKAKLGYEALSTRLGEQAFFFESRPTTADAIFLGHALFVLYALPDSSVLRSSLLNYDNLVRYTQNFKEEFLDSSGSSSQPRPPLVSASSSTPGRTSTNSSSKPKPKPKPKTEEEKSLRRKAKYFIAGQFVSIVLFLSLMGNAVAPEYEDGNAEAIEYQE